MNIIPRPKFLNIQMKLSRLDITPPNNLQHSTHVNYNSSTGEYVGLPRQWETIISTKRLPNGNLGLNNMYKSKELPRQSSANFRTNPYNDNTFSFRNIVYQNSPQIFKVKSNFHLNHQSEEIIHR
ncbi:unnamed protein product [Heterobilharzia americana]|nr:unnamed protein product [Heterobilharzia americana]